MRNYKKIRDLSEKESVPRGVPGAIRWDSGERLQPVDILTPKQLAERLQVPVSWIYKHTDRSRGIANRLPVLRCDGYLRFSWPDVVAWMRSK